MPETRLLYYPNFNANDLLGLKRALLLYGGVSVIAPQSTPFVFSILSDEPDPQAVEQRGALGGPLAELPGDPPAEGINIQFLPDYEIIHERREEFFRALDEDLQDQAVQTWAKRWIAARGRREPAWFVTQNYLGGDFAYGNPAYGVEMVTMPDWSKLVRLPFLVGMSLGLSEALWASVDQGLTLFTDDPTSQEFLMLRLKRGWRHLTHDQELQRAFGIEQELMRAYATAYLGTWTLALKIPRFMEDVATRSLREIVDYRRHADRRQALERLQAGLDKLVTTHELWKARDFREFESEAYKVVQAEIVPAFEALEQRPLNARDLMQAIDPKELVKSASENAPALLAQATVGLATGGMVALATAGAAIPVFLAAVAGGLAPSFAAKLTEAFVKHRKERRSAEFLTYAVNLREALSSP